MKYSVMPINSRQVKSGIVHFCLYVFLLANLFPQKLIAQGRSNINPTGVYIKYLGFANEKLLFLVNIENTNSERCNIFIKDEKGELLYSQEFRGTRFTKTFGINKEELEGQRLVFELSRGKVKQDQVFEVTTNTRVIQDVVVAKQ